MDFCGHSFTVSNVYVTCIHSWLAQFGFFFCNRFKFLYGALNLLVLSSSSSHNFLRKQTSLSLFDIDEHQSYYNQSCLGNLSIIFLQIPAVFQAESEPRYGFRMNVKINKAIPYIKFKMFAFTSVSNMLIEIRAHMDSGDYMRIKNALDVVSRNIKARIPIAPFPLLSPSMCSPF